MAKVDASRVSPTLPDGSLRLGSSGSVQGHLPASRHPHHAHGGGWPIPLSSPFLTGLEERYLRESLASKRLAGDGPFTRRVRTVLERDLPAQKVLLTTSCTSALELAALLLQDRAGAEAPAPPEHRPEVIVPAFTFVSTVNAFLMHGYKPVFCDVREDTGNADASTIAPRLTSDTRVIVPVHYAGVPCDMEPILALARDRAIDVVEDAAQALTSTMGGRSAGTFGALAAFSFHDTKNFVCGEGGALVVNRPDLAARAEIMREKGTNRAQFLQGHVDKYTWVDLGGSFLSSDLLAALLLAQLEGRELICRRRRELFARYMEALAPLAARGALRLPVVPPHVTTNHHLFFVVTESAELRTRLLHFLNVHGVGAAFHYPALHKTPMGRLLHDGAPLPVAERLGERLLRLPLYVDLSDEDQERVIEVIRTFFIGTH